MSTAWSKTEDPAVAEGASPQDGEPIAQQASESGVSESEASESGVRAPDSVSPRGDSASTHAGNAPAQISETTDQDAVTGDAPASNSSEDSGPQMRIAGVSVSKVLPPSWFAAEQSADPVNPPVNPLVSPPAEMPPLASTGQEDFDDFGEPTAPLDPSELPQKPAANRRASRSGTDDLPPSAEPTTPAEATPVFAPSPSEEQRAPAHRSLEEQAPPAHASVTHKPVRDLDTASTARDPGAASVSTLPRAESSEPSPASLSKVSSTAAIAASAPSQAPAATAPAAPAAKPERDAARRTTGDQDDSTEPEQATIESITQRKTRKANKKQVQLRLVRIDFWSCVKLAFLLSFSLAIIGIVVSFIIWKVLEQTGVFESINNLLNDVVRSRDAVDITQMIPLDQVMLFACGVGVLNCVVVPALAAVCAMIYNFSVRVTGGLVFGFSNY